LSLHLFMYCIMFMDLCMLNHPCKVYDLFVVLLNSVCQYFVENHCIYIH
jgi:hypothetical protein